MPTPCPLLPLSHHTQGEAIAFALGGTRRMLRAKSHAALINDAAHAAGGAGATAQVGSPCALPPPRRTRPGTRMACAWQPRPVGGSSREHAGRHSHHAPPAPLQVALHFAARGAAAPADPGGALLSVRRTVRGDGSTQTHARAQGQERWRPVTQVHGQGGSMEGCAHAAAWAPSPDCAPRLMPRGSLCHLPSQNHPRRSCRSCSPHSGCSWTRSTGGGPALLPHGTQSHTPMPALHRTHACTAPMRRCPMR
jgi:hypothetical protein